MIARHLLRLLHLLHSRQTNERGTEGSIVVPHSSLTFVVCCDSNAATFRDIRWQLHADLIVPLFEANRHQPQKNHNKDTTSLLLSYIESSINILNFRLHDTVGSTKNAKRCNIKRRILSGNFIPMLPLRRTISKERSSRK